MIVLRLWIRILYVPLLGNRTLMALYMYGGMYGIFAGEKVDNVQVDFVNADSGEIISTGNSKDMGNGN